MTSDSSAQPISPLRARMIEDMTVRGFAEKTRHDLAEKTQPAGRMNVGERGQEEPPEQSRQYPDRQ